MDVTCERCSTEYEFDETLVSERGTTVKCTNCGHLFKVYRSAGEGERPWILKRNSGATQTLASLRDLQQAITQGKIDEDDQISRSGEAWKRLGDIAELRTFFQAAAAAAAPPKRPPIAPKKQTLFGVGGTPSAPGDDEKTRAARAPVRPRTPTPSAGPPPRPPKPTPQPALPPVAPAPPPKAPPPQAPARSTAPQPTPKPPAPKPPAPKPPAPKAALPKATKPTAPKGPRAPSLDAEDSQNSGPVRAPRLAEPTERVPRPRREVDLELESPRRGRPFLWGLLILLAAAGVTVGLLWDQIGPRLGFAAGGPAQGFMESGDVAYSLGTVDGYDEAVREYTRASAVASEDADVHAALGRAEAAWAQALAFSAEDLEAQAATAEAATSDEDGEEEEDESDAESETAEDDEEEGHEADARALRGEAAHIRQELDRHIDAAQESAEAALALSPAHGGAEVVLANAERLRGNLDAAQSHIDQAQERLPERTVDFHLARALLAAAQGTIADAEEGARAALALNDHSVAAHLVLARVHLAAGANADARSELDAVLTQVPGHDEATRLRARLGDAPEAPSADAPEGEGAQEETAPDAPETPSEESPESTPAATDTPAARNADEGRSRRDGTRPAAEGPPPGGRDYSWYIAQGDSLMDRGDVGRAREFYQAAVEERPGASEALTGLGFVELERRRYDSAVRYFQQARRAGYSEAFIGLGDALRRLGRNDEAIAVYEDYLARRPNGSQANVARRQIDALRASQTPSTPEPSDNTPSDPENGSGEDTAPEPATDEPEPATEEPAPAEPETPPPAETPAPAEEATP